MTNGPVIERPLEESFRTAMTQAVRTQTANYPELLERRRWSRRSLSPLRSCRYCACCAPTRATPRSGRSWTSACPR